MTEKLDNTPVPLGAETGTRGGVTPAGVTGPSEQPLAVGTVLGGRYELLRFVARGAMGEVYEAMDLELRTRLAVKTVRGHLAGNPDAIERVRREVQLARAVTDAHVCRLFDLGHADVEGKKVTFITMELLEGESLRDRLSKGPLAPAQALPFALDVAQGLAACHAVGVIHRDLKAENVLVVKRADREHAVLSDFGIARLEVGAARSDEVDDASLTQEGQLVGSLAFIAPEQLNGVKANQRTDLYGLGALLWELVVGRWPLRGKETLEIVRQLAQIFPPPEAFPRDLDPRWSEVLHRCLAQRPEERFSSAQEVLDTLLPDGPPRRTSSSAIRATIPPARPGRRPALVVGAAVAVALLVGALLLQAQRPTSTAAPVAAPAAPSSEVVLEQLQRHEERLEFAQARALAKSLGNPGLAAFHLALAEGGLGHWAAAADAAKQGLAQQPPLGRRQKLQLELVERRASGDQEGALNLHESLYTTAERDPMVGLAYAEALIPRAKLDEAQRVLDGVGVASLSPALRARLSLARAFRANTFPRVVQADVDTHARAAMEAAQSVGARVIEGRAKVLLASAALFQGRPDEASTTMDDAIKLLEAAEDPFLTWAYRMRAAIIINSGGKTEDSLRATVKAVELGRAVKDDVALALALNVLGVVKKDAGALAEAIEAYRESEEVSLRAGREDIAETRARPNRTALLDDLGKVTEATRLLEELGARRPDPSGLETLNLATMYRAAGDTVKARAAMGKMDAVLAATQNQGYRWMQQLALAELALDEGNAAVARTHFAKAEALLKAMGASDSDVDLALARSLAALDPAPQEAARLLPSLANPDLTMLQLSRVTSLLARAQVRLGKRDEALALQAKWAEKATLFQQFAAGNLGALLLAAELAEGADAQQEARRALEAFARQTRADGHVLWAWESQLGLARLALRAGDKRGALSTAAALGVEVKKSGFVRLQRAVDVVMKAAR